MKYWPLVTLLACLACDPGPVLYLGTPRSGDGGALDAGAPDAAPPERADASGDADDDDVPCISTDECLNVDGEPYCHAELLECVECLDDSHCDPEEHCDLSEGDCEDD